MEPFACSPSSFIYRWLCEYREYSRYAKYMDIISLLKNDVCYCSASKVSKENSLIVDVITKFRVGFSLQRTKIILSVSVVILHWFPVNVLQIKHTATYLRFAVPNFWLQRNLGKLSLHQMREHNLACWRLSSRLIVVQSWDDINERFHHLQSC